MVSWYRGIMACIEQEVLVQEDNRKSDVNRTGLYDIAQLLSKFSTPIIAKMSNIQVASGQVPCG